MDEPGEHHSQQTDTRTENQTPHVLIVQHSLMSENICCLFSIPVLVLRIIVSSFIDVPAEDMNSSFLWLHSIPLYICDTFSVSSLSLMGISVGSKSLLL